jgi:hypothetical protein
VFDAPADFKGGETYHLIVFSNSRLVRPAKVVWKRFTLEVSLDDHQVDHPNRQNDYADPPAGVPQDAIFERERVPFGRTCQLGSS